MLLCYFRDFMIVREITDEKQLGVFAKMADRSVSNVWIGCAGVVTHLHNDYAHNFYFQIDGYKVRIDRGSAACLKGSSGNYRCCPLQYLRMRTCCAVP